MVNLSFLNLLKGKRNILAYSGGTDSNALFYLLLENNIEFDLIHVNYNVREESILEERLASYLASSYNKDLLKKSFEFKEIPSSFEAKARKLRYDFFEEIINRYSYENLVLGHNLNDKVEWFLMQFTKGAGSKELFGMEGVVKKGNYSIVRPLINVSKDNIYSYLKENNIKYYEDSSNQNESFRRNYFRHNFSNELVSKFEKGIKRTFEILEKENKDKGFDIIINEKDFVVLNTSFENRIFAADQMIKRMGTVLSYAQRKTLEKNNVLDFVVDGKKFVVSYSFYYKRILITPYLKTVMTKKFKNKIRDYDLDIDPKHRPFFFENQEKLEKIKG